MSTKLEDWTVLSMLQWGTEYFKKQDIPDPRLSIEWLLAETLQVKRLDLYLKFDRPLSQAELDEIRPLVKKRAKHIPLQYIVGYTDFMNAHIKVTPEVLIPRIETEQLVEIILDDYPNESSGEISTLDIGTGSGCIPIALKMERPHWNIDALDISEEALDIARENAEINETDITFMQGDILEREKIAFDKSYDIIVSNPPYVLSDEKNELEKQVVLYEPSLALFCDSMENIYGNIIKFSENHLKNNGKLYLEIHEKYSSRILQFFDDAQWQTSLLKDYGKKPRFIIAKLAK